MYYVEGFGASASQPHDQGLTRFASPNVLENPEGDLRNRKAFCPGSRGSHVSGKTWRMFLHMPCIVYKNVAHVLVTFSNNAGRPFGTRMLLCKVTLRGFERSWIVDSIGKAQITQ